MHSRHYGIYPIIIPQCGRAYPGDDVAILMYQRIDKRPKAFTSGHMVWPIFENS